MCLSSAVGRSTLTHQRPRDVQQDLEALVYCLNIHKQTLSAPAPNMSDLDASSYLNISEAATSQPAIVNPSYDPNGDVEELDDLPSEPDSDEETIDDEIESDAEREWKESLEQLELLMTMVLVPYLGKFFGRKFAYWGWKQFMEWKYPVTIEFTNKKAFNLIGAIEAAATL